MQSATLAQVLITDTLFRRPSRKPDDLRLDEAVLDLNRLLSLSPNQVLQKLAEKALELCRADSVVISILERGPQDEVFRWRAAAGALFGALGTALPRDQSPCGMALDQDADLLFAHPEHHFPFPAPVNLPIREALVTPFYDATGTARGAIWIVAHRRNRIFDAEDLRLVTGLALFARSAMATLESLGYEQSHERRASLLQPRAEVRERRNAGGPGQS